MLSDRYIVEPLQKLLEEYRSVNVKLCTPIAEGGGFRYPELLQCERKNRETNLQGEKDG